MDESGAAGGGGAVARDELRAVLFFLSEGGIGFEATAAASFVGAHRTDDNEFFAFNQALGVNGGVAATHAYGQQLGDFFGDGQKARHGFEGAAAVIGVQSGDDDALAEIGELGANIHNFIAEELRFVNADDFRARRELLHDFRGFEDGVRGNAQAGMRDDLVGGVAFINGGLEDLHALARNLCTAQPANKLFALAGKHRTDNDFDPAHIAFDDIHGFSLKPILSLSFPFSVFSKNSRV
jgi:hypothetical protein